jgi:uncharacterized protein Yka (UPF0111/DUF47 family)
MSNEDRKSLDKLYGILEEWKHQESEIRKQMKMYGKALSGSGFDFEKAIRYRELLDEEKKRLDKVHAAIEEIEKQIDEIEGG